MNKKILIIVLYLFSIGSFAWNPEDHKIISERAAQLYNSCISNRDGEKIYISKVEVSSFAKGSSDEDTRDIIGRIRNWHFYKSNKNIDGNFFFTHHNSIIFKKRFIQLRNSFNGKANQDFFYWAGRLSHHIQDMAVPSHVVPIYHATPPFGVKDRLESYDSKKWLSVELNESECDKLFSEQISSPRSVLDDLAHKTLKSVKMPILSGKTVPTWQSFWRSPENTSKLGVNVHSGFGSYGNFGNRFGITIKTICDNGESCIIAKREYEQYISERYIDAVKATIQVIRIIRSY